jgi:saccharopine dehydrogenase (NAD+, L-lysine forming)
MKENILIIGGYGKVGSIICTHLSNLFPKKIIVAGRSLKKAQQLAKTLEYKVVPRILDVFDPVDSLVLDDIRLIIMCIDQKDSKFVELCIKKGIHYIDITASQNFISQIELLNEKARLYNASIILSTGLAPGITNLLAQHCANQLSEITLIDIFILLGIGERHGEAAFRWTFDHIHSSYQVKLNGQSKVIKSFSMSKECNLSGKRKFYTFNFPDQHILAQSLLSGQILTRLAFDSKLLTNGIALLRKLGITRIFNFKRVQSTLIWLFNIIDIGGDDYGVKVVAQSRNNHIYECSIEGKGEGKITAYVAIQAALYLLNNDPPGGVKHIHQLIEDIPSFMDSLKQFDDSIEIKYGIKFKSKQK